LTVSEYIQKRRLALSIQLLDERTSTVLEVALKSGYKSHEVFCRNFKKAFGLTPSQYRIQTPELPCFERLHIVERDFVNKNADIIVNYEIVHLDELSLTGQYVNFHTDNREAIEMAYRQVYDFAAQNVEAGGADKLYNVSLEKDASQKLSYFTGIDKSKCKKASLKKEAYKDIVTIPPATYAVFKYKGHFKYVFKTALYMT
ncbi:Transcription regulator HTH, AraC- type like protein, partial [Aduncisulcus paluster]